MPFKVVFTKPVENGAPDGKHVDAHVGVELFAPDDGIQKSYIVVLATLLDRVSSLERLLT